MTGRTHGWEEFCQWQVFSQSPRPDSSSQKPPARQYALLDAGLLVHAVENREERDRSYADDNPQRAFFGPPHV